MNTEETIVEEKVVDPSKPQYDIIESRQQVNLFLAGQGSGKSFIGGVVSGIFIITFPKVHGFIGANTHLQLSDSTLYRIRQVWKEYFGWTEWSRDNPRGNYVVGIQPPSHFDTTEHNYETYRGKICFEAGTVVYMGSLANYEAHEGKEFAWAILDETKDTKEEAVKEVITGRLREHGMFVAKDGSLWETMWNKDSGEQHTPWNPLYILTSPAKVQWINEWFKLDDYIDEITKLIYSGDTYFVKDIDNKRVTISSVFHNRKNLPSTYIPNQIANLHSGLQDMLIYGNPFSSSGGEFYKCFKRTVNVIDVMKYMIPEEYADANKLDFDNLGFTYNGRPYNPQLPLHISYDFNVNPYMTCTIWQIIGKTVLCIDEICLKNPNNTTEQVSKEFARRYSGHKAGVFVYGDPSGRREDTRVDKRTERGHNDYLIIMTTLAHFNPINRVSKVAPSVVMRGNFINTIFEKGYKGIEIFIHHKCVETINDYTYMKEASDGSKLKEKVKNPDTLVTYEKYGHTSDSGDYFICKAFANEYSEYQQGGMTGSPKTGRGSASRNSY